MTAWYNENDPYAAQWLRNLVAAGHIAAGDVDERSIVDVRADDLRGYTQCHFFAGIGGWSHALRLAGWPDDRPVWTGSCPCQPFSAAGKGQGGADDRHLWPHWFRLIRECRPAVVFGEQVEAAIGWGWLDAVFADLEGEGYATGAAVLPACGVGAPHIRQRLWFVAHAERGVAERGRHDLAGTSRAVESQAWERQRLRDDARPSGEPDGVANAGHDDRAARPARREQQSAAPIGPRSRSDSAAGSVVDTAREQEGLPRRTRQPGSADSELAHAHRQGQRQLGRSELLDGKRQAQRHDVDGCGQLGNAGPPGLPFRQQQELPGENEFHEGRAVEQPSLSPWTDLEWLPCSDGKARPVEPGTFPLAHGVPGRVGRLRAYGNAIVPQVAAEFIKAADATGQQAG